MESLEALAVLLFYASFLLLFVFMASTRKGDLSIFGETLADFTIEPGRRWFRRHDTLEGTTRAGRRLRLIDRGQSIVYMVQLRGWRRTVRLAKADLLEKVEQSAGTQERALRAALNDLFGPLSFAEVVLKDGWLRVERQSFLSAFQVDSVQRVFAQLERIAPLYDGIELRIKGSDTLSIGLTAGGEQARCPYCHDGVDVDGDDVCACDSCTTLHHRSCLEENGQCTVLGCSGSRREPPAVVA